MELSASDIRQLKEKDLVTTHVSNGIPAGMEDEENTGEDYFYGDDDDDCDAEPVVARPKEDVSMLSYLTPKGCHIAHGTVPTDVLEKFDTFSVCKWCGIVFWPVTFDELFLYD